MFHLSISSVYILTMVSSKYVHTVLCFDQDLKNEAISVADNSGQTRGEFNNASTDVRLYTL